VDGFAQQAAPIFADLISKDFHPRRMVDVGCGTGALIQALTATGCECKGLEYADAAIKTCQARGLNVRKFDIESEIVETTSGEFDVVTSMEVGEHLPKEKADRYIVLLTSLAPVVIYTAAIPGQGGSDHVNEQPHEYWIEKFERRGYRYEKGQSERWRKETKEREMPYFYSDNIMIFQKR
jgi:SAM-dependent methyltransferase